MNPTYLYVLEKCGQLIDAPEDSILDYGCGAGDVVEAGRRRGLNMFGVEAFYAGGNTRESIAAKGYLGNIVRELEDGAIPFPDGSFKLVVANQVFEHVPDLKPVLREIHRVLTPGGKLFCIFPSRDVIREGHCGVPMVHWFGKDNPLRFPYMYFFRCLGMGHNKFSKSRSEWTRDMLAWLDSFTFYQPLDSIRSLFDAQFVSSRHIEEDFLHFRLLHKGLKTIAAASLHPALAPGSRLICRKLGGLVMISEKSLESGPKNALKPASLTAT